MIDRKLLVIVPHDAALAEFIRFFLLSRSASPVFYLCYESAYLSRIEENGWQYVCNYSCKQRKRSWQRSVTGWFLNETWVGVVAQTYLLRGKLAKKLKKSIENFASRLEEIVNEFEVKGFLISSDRGCGAEAGAILCAKRLGLPVHLLSFAYSADFQSSYKIRDKKIYSYCSAQSAPIVHADPELGSKAFYRPFETQALRELGLLSKNPWVLGAGQINGMLVDSERERDRLVRLGGNAADYIVTGLASHDLLYEKSVSKEQLKKAIRSRYSLDENPIILLSMPQYWEHHLCEREQHFGALEEMVRLLTEIPATVLVSLHPKMDRNNYEWVARYQGARIVREDVSELIPVCDVFVATYSSTVQWALMCHKNIAVIDHIGLNYKFLSEFDLPIFQENKALALYIKDVLLNWGCSTNQEYFYPLKEVKKLSPFDGKCVDRIEKIISK